MGWLHSRPKRHDKDKDVQARAVNLQEGDPLLDLPEADDFLVSCWHDLGMCTRGGYGNSPLTFTEVKAYSDSVADLTPFDCSTLVRMSRDYCSENAAATEDINRPAPHEGEASIELMRANTAKALKAMFSK